MITVQRYSGNPILSPDPSSDWQAKATFNGSPIDLGTIVGLLYRAVGKDGTSTIGIAEGCDGLSFTHRRPLLYPEYDWEKYGCEDPRITKLGDTYYIFYTALSTFPFTASGIRVGVALTRDLLTISEKHPVTPFNAKAMALFPDLVNNEVAAIVSVHTDMPPAKLCVVRATNPEDLWNEQFWKKWYASLDSHVIPLQKSSADQVESGAAPILTDKGWLLIYCYITDYTSPHPTFGIDAALLDKDDPQVVLGRLHEPLLTPQESYEKIGLVPNVIFPSGALVRGNMLTIYYGATDTTVCAATVSLPDLLTQLQSKKSAGRGIKLTRFAENPIIEANPDHAWEAKAVFNAAAITLGGSVRLVYRALSHDDTSTLGLATSADGLHIATRSDEPVYVPRQPFEQKRQPGYSGCEDPRMTAIGDRIYMLYTAWSGEGSPRVALTSIAVSDFLKNNWQWDVPQLITPAGIDDKNACVLPEKMKGKYIFLHRFGNSIWVDAVDLLTFAPNHFLSGTVLMEPRSTGWDSDKIGITGPPIHTKDGWLLLYHGLSKTDRFYRLGASLLAPDDPFTVVARLDNPILEPEMDYENIGVRPGTVFSCGSVVIGKTLYVYYGGADQVICVATIPLDTLLSSLKK